MTTIFENPLPAILIGGLMTLILAGGWMQTGRRALLFLTLTAVAATVVLVIVERIVITDREAVTISLHQIAAHVERNEIDQALAYAYSKTPEVRERAAAELPKYNFREVAIKRNLEIEVDPDHVPPKAVAEFNVTVELSVKDGSYNGRVPRFVTVTFLQEDDGSWGVADYEHQDPTQGYRIRE